MRFLSSKLVVVRHLATLAVLFLACAGCSRFEKRWREAAADVSGTTAMVGRWQGTWKSDANGHTDELRCIITATGTDQFNAHYHARYRRGLFRFRFQYAVPLVAKPSGDRWSFSGSADLGWLAGGIYRYEGVVSSNQFHSTYDSRYDRGQFYMQRVKESGGR